MTLRGYYRTDHQQQRIKATINVIASLRSGVATMGRVEDWRADVRRNFIGFEVAECFPTL